MALLANQLEELFSVEDAAAILKISKQTLWDWIRFGIVPAYGGHKSTRVRISEVLEATRLRVTQERLKRSEARKRSKVLSQLRTTPCVQEAISADESSNTIEAEYSVKE